MDNCQRSQFERDGYIVLDDILDSGALDNIRQEYKTRLSGLCQNWTERGLLETSVISDSFDRQIMAASCAGIDFFQPLDISLPIDRFDNDVPMHLGKSVFSMIRNNRLLDAVELLIGPEITSNPIQHVRIKPPLEQVGKDEIRSHVIKTDWHQDRAVALEQADNTRMVTAWLAITDATEENGCLQVIPGSHKKPMQPHCPQSQLGIPEKNIAPMTAQPLPVNAGGAVLIHPLTIHGSLDNKSNGIRWSFDLRYNVSGEPTGRPQFPEFVARSRSNPEAELTSFTTWADMWLATRARLAHPQAPQAYHRWDGSHPVCA